MGEVLRQIKIKCGELLVQMSKATGALQVSAGQDGCEAENETYTYVFCHSGTEGV